MTRKDWVEVVVALLLFVTSAIALFFSCQANTISEEALSTAKETLKLTVQAPFDPVVVASDPIWKAEQTSGTEINLALITTVLISNQGAQTGCIADIIAVMKLPMTGDHKTLKAYNFLNTEKLLGVVAEDNPKKRRHIYEAREAPYSPIFVLGKQQITKTIAFRNPRFKKSDIKEGNYEISLAANDCLNKDKWKYYTSSTFFIERDQVEHLLEGNFIVFESEERIKAAKKLRLPIK